MGKILNEINIARSEFIIMTKELQRKLRKEIAPFEKSKLSSSVWQMVNSMIPFFILWFLAYQSLSVSYLLTLLFAIPAAGFLIRIFIIFHDCCHQSFFKNRKANDVVGTITGILTLFPYKQWRHNHNVHHATSGNLNKRGVGDIWVMTVQEYEIATFWQKVAYRLYRNPLVMFLIGPFYLLFITNRFNRKEAEMNERLNTYFINLLHCVYLWNDVLVDWLAGISLDSRSD